VLGYGVSQDLEKLGVVVEYMGQPLTEFLKNDDFRILTVWRGFECAYALLYDSSIPLNLLYSSVTGRWEFHTLESFSFQDRFFE